MQRLIRPSRAMVSLLAACAVGLAAAPAAAATAPIIVWSAASATSTGRAPVYQTFSTDGWFQTGQGAPSTGSVNVTRAATTPAGPSYSNGSVWIYWSSTPTTASGGTGVNGGGTAPQGSSASGGVSAGAPSGGPANEASAARQIVQWTNQTRAQHGLPALAENRLLDKVALAKCQDMIVHNYFSDNSPTYGSPLQMQQAFGVQARIIGAENIAGARTPQLAYAMLTASAPHLANILYHGLTDIGVAVVPYGVYGVYVCQEFTGN